jgi:uncharacterized protein YndB with AHSA1/START domain
MNHSDVRLRRTIAAPPIDIYRAWLEPELLRRWFAAGDLEATYAEVQPWVGGRHRVWQSEPDGTDVGGTEGVLIELVPAERIVLSWHFVGPDRITPAAEESLLTVTFRPGTEVGSTDLTLIHERLDGLRAAHPEVAGCVTTGWSSVLDQLTTEIGASR